MDPLTITIQTNKDFDGATPITGTRDDFEVSKNNRYYHRRITTSAGVIASDFWGLFSEGGPKLVGVAGSSRNPQNKVAVFRNSPLGLTRQTLPLTPQIQYLLMTPGDQLLIRTRDLLPVFLTLTVNEISEREHAELVRQDRWEPPVQRLRLGRNDGQGFSAAGGVWSPAFAWNHTSQLLEVAEPGAGLIVLSDVLQAQRYQGFYVSVRYSNMIAAGTGKVIIAEPTTLSRREAQTGLTNVEWSKPQYISHGDLLGLESSAPAAGQGVVADIEVTPVPSGDRLRGRYDRAL
ncbi:hypothetical protein SAMN02745121_08205 [Nannocystis exedens]|uniref:Uncharacterized protein n=1 Tax=Nannocystis exedens TaxID=54 RepID=A0A1I2HTA3_9BACT|nr:hypothetical protein [Nannocystis exedens]PCC73182.1 hypothetical protein NAEX_06270 [Nannocystis exedens]SFF33274.1 hypothetical protein SAMN02745121_08205 [Nannocystis exedens]